MPARSIRIFMPDGSTTGLRTAEIGLSTVKAVMCSRTQLSELAHREEAARTGVYVLVGWDPAYASRAAIYVGEGDLVMDRLYSHDKDPAKDFFERVILFVSKDQNLTKAHVRWIEARMIERAKSANRATVLNGTAPVGGQLPESDSAEMEEFLSQAGLLAATLGLNVFEAPPAPIVETEAAADEPRYQVSMIGDGFNARAVLADGVVVILKGSVARSKESASLGANARSLRGELAKSGTLLETPSGLVFAQDYAFGSPSGAAQVVCGSSVNGWDVWRLANGQSLQSVRGNVIGVAR